MRLNVQAPTGSAVAVRKGAGPAGGAVMSEAGLQCGERALRRRLPEAAPIRRVKEKVGERSGEARQEPGPAP